MREKRAFYSRPEISDRYDDQRFGGPSGERVHAREIALVTDLLGSSGVDRSGRVLDLACGTGRLTRVLVAQKRQVVAIDASPPMAAKAATSGAPTLLGDAFALPFRKGAFDAVVALRLAFHFQELGALLAEMGRVIGPGGMLVFDTYAWSPRALWAMGAQRWGGRVFLHRKAEVERAAFPLGLQVQEMRPCFLFSPYVYRLAPLPLERALERLESVVPADWLCRVFWKLRAESAAGGATIMRAAAE